MAATFRQVRQRRHIHPDGSWGMAIDVPYPQLVEQNGLAFTRGQCALDENGRVLRPHDLLGQTDIIMAGLRGFLDPLHIPRSHMVRAVVYYIDNGAIGQAELLAHMAQCLDTPGIVSVVPVPLSHFYYDGMMVEIDFTFAQDLANPVKSERRYEPFADAVTANDLLYVSQLTADIPGEGAGLPQQLASIRDQLAGLLDAAGCEIDDVLKLTTCFVGSPYDWARIAEARSEWFTDAYPVITDIAVERLADPGARLAVDAVAVRRQAPNHWRRQPVFAPGSGGWPIPLPHPQAIQVGDLLITGGQLAVSGEDGVLAPYDIDAQTRLVMDHLGRLLDEADMSFADVVKATTYYRGGPAADDLHDNLQIRSSYYRAPGPASTGVPVAGLAAAAAMISVEVMAIT
ncbi:MAG: RidA family protein [Hyphomicrobiales bacterium]